MRNDVPLYQHARDGLLAVYAGQAEAMKSHIEMVQAYMPHAVPFSLDNVAEWLETNHGGTANAQLVRDLPACVPPYPVMWSEMSADEQGNPQNRLGVLVLTEKRTPKTEWNPWRMLGVNTQIVVPDGEETYTEFEIPENGFIVSAMALAGNAILAGGRVPLILPGAIFAGLDEHGRVLRNGNYIAMRFVTADVSDLSDEESEAVISQLGTAFVTTLFGSSLCHCANVGEVEHRLNRQQARERERKRLPLIAWKTIVVEPVRKPRNAAETAEYLDGEKHARRMHMVRGHFAEYGPEFGKGKLFGKISGRFWIPAMVKGSPTEGINVSDYRVMKGSK